MKWRVMLRLTQRRKKHLYEEIIVPYPSGMVYLAVSSDHSPVTNIEAVRLALKWAREHPEQKLMEFKR